MIEFNSVIDNGELDDRKQLFITHFSDEFEVVTVSSIFWLFGLRGDFLDLFKSSSFDNKSFNSFLFETYPRTNEESIQYRFYMNNKHIIIKVFIFSRNQITGNFDEKLIDTIKPDHTFDNNNFAVKGLNLMFEIVENTINYFNNNDIKIALK